jgi:hypothetical protein
MIRLSIVKAASGTVCAREEAIVLNMLYTLYLQNNVDKVAVAV